MTRPLLWILTLLLCCRASASTVTGYLQDLTGQNRDTTVLVQPLNTPQVYGTNWITSGTKTVQSSNGTFSIVLRPGQYRLIPGSRTNDTAVIGVPNDNATYNFLDLLTNTLARTWREPPAVLKVSTNDTTAGYLARKLLAGTNITVTINNPGADETLTVAAAGGGGGGADLTNYVRKAGDTGIGQIVPSTSNLVGTVIDPSTSSIFTATVSTDTTFTFTNLADGQHWTVILTSIGSPQVQWTDVVVLPGSTLRAPPNAGQIYFFLRLGGITFGEGAIHPALAAFVGLTNAAGILTNDGDGALSWSPAGFAPSITTAAPAGHSAQAWQLGEQIAPDGVTNLVISVGGQNYQILAVPIP